MKVIVLANWGIGYEVLKALDRLSDTEIFLVVTRYDVNNRDKWYNIVYNFACQCGYKTKFERFISFDELRESILKSDIDVLVSHAFMRILPKAAFSAPKYGSINIHASLLPKYRGPSPTYWVLKNKETVTGLTCHYIDEGVDTGDIIYQVEVPVKSDDTIETIIEKQKKITGLLITESLARITNKNFHPLPQNNELVSYAPKPR
jgi:methionyl-tRNA formyltransferase